MNKGVQNLNLIKKLWGCGGCQILSCARWTSVKNSKISSLMDVALGADHMQAHEADG